MSTLPYVAGDPLVIRGTDNHFQSYFFGHESNSFVDDLGDCTIYRDMAQALQHAAAIRSFQRHLDPDERMIIEVIPLAAAKES